MTISRHELTISVTLKSPFILGGLDAAGVGIDTMALRDQRGHAILPGDHLKGLLREALLTLPKKALDGFDVDDLLGRSSEYEAEAVTQKLPRMPDPFAPSRGELLFRDLVVEDVRTKYQRDITRIEIDDDTGAVKTGQLQVIELVAPLGAEASFSGSMLWAGNAARATSLAKLLEKALRIVPYFGGARSAGFGEHLRNQAKVTAKLAPDGSVAWPKDAQRAGITAVFDRAFLVSADRKADNVFSGADHVLGNVIKGALALMLAREGRSTAPDMPLGKALAMLSVSHALPIDGSGMACGLPIPFSIMRAARNDHHFADALENATPGLMPGDAGPLLCVDFQPDWKPAHFTEARRRAQRPIADLASLARGHTRINRKTGVAQDQGLFMEVARGHLSDAGESVRFRFTVDASKALTEHPSEASFLLSRLCNGIDAMGKTNAGFMPERAEPDTALSAPPGTPTNGKLRWRVLLETQSVLTDPDADGAGFLDVTTALARYVSDALPGAKLIDHFARRRLIGGYQRQRRKGGARYSPLSLFEAGTCLLIEADAVDAVSVAARLQEYMAFGLPVMAMTGEGLRPVTDWREMPYLPEHGYGRISVDADVFRDVTKAMANGDAA
jgi:hypothetical protein